MVAPVILLLACLRWHRIVGYTMIVTVGRQRRNGMTIMNMRCMLNHERVICVVEPHLGLSGQRGYDKHANGQSGDNAHPSVNHVPCCSHVILPLPAYSLA